MRVQAPWLAVALVALAAAPPLMAYPDTPPVARAGDPPANATCDALGCHSQFALNAGDVTLALLDAATRTPVGGYEPGAAQALVFRVTSGEPFRRAWGFELTALSSAAMGGSFQPGTGSQVQSSGGRQYLSHALGGIGQGETTGHEWVFTWVPPATDVGVVRFFACANAANGTGSQLGDYIECTTFDVVALPGPPDADGDGLSDADEILRGTNPADPDTDNDLVLDGADTCPLLRGAPQADFDGDAFGDACDDCRVFADPSQQDADSDGIGNACEIAWGDVAPRGAPDGQITIGDAVVVLRMSVQLETPTAAELRRANVAPATIVAGSPDVATPTLAPPVGVDIGDAVLILRASVQLTRFPDPR
jgi:hypothetical protein